MPTHKSIHPCMYSLSFCVSCCPLVLWASLLMWLFWWGFQDGKKQIIVEILWLAPWCMYGFLEISAWFHWPLIVCFSCLSFYLLFNIPLCQWYTPKNKDKKWSMISEAFMRTSNSCSWTNAAMLLIYFSFSVIIDYLWLMHHSVQVSSKVSQTS